MIIAGEEGKILYWTIMPLEALGATDLVVSTTNEFVSSTEFNYIDVAGDDFVNSINTASVVSQVMYPSELFPDYDLTEAIEDYAYVF